MVFDPNALPQVKPSKFDFVWIDKEFAVCPDCGKEQQVDTEGRRLVITVSRNDEIVGYKCGWCRGRLEERRKEDGT